MEDKKENKINVKKRRSTKSKIITVLLGISFFCVFVFLLLAIFCKEEFFETSKCDIKSIDCSKECNCEKCNETAEDEIIYTTKYLNAKYQNISDRESYIHFDVSNETWEANINECEGYALIKGKYVDEENGYISLKNGEETFGTLRIVSVDNSNNIILLKEIPKDESIQITGCSGTKYFVIEK